MAITRKVCRCGNWYQSAIRTICAACARQDERAAKRVMNKSPYIAPPAPHVFKQVNDEETIWMLASFIRKREDLGTSSPVTHYRPGDSGFMDLARQYGGAPA